MSVIRTQCRSSQVEFYRHAMLSSRKYLVSLLSSPRGTEGEAQQAAGAASSQHRLDSFEALYIRMCYMIVHSPHRRIAVRCM